MFSYSENIAHFKGGISYEVQKSFYLVVQVVAASIVATSIITAQPVYAAGGNVFDGNR
jgi:hypothetical protein